MNKFLLSLILGVTVLIAAACAAGQTSAPAPTEEVAVEQPTPPAQAEQTALSDNAASPEAAAAGESPTEPPTPTTAEPATPTEPAVTEETSTGSEAMVDVSAPAEASPAEGSANLSESAADIRIFVIVPEQSKASYVVAEEFFGGALDQLGIQPGLVDTIGSTQEISGEMQLNLSDLSAPQVSNQFEVNLQSLTSNQSRRDNQIRQRWLESNRYPLAQFTITSLENLPESYSPDQEVTFQASGDITVREVTRPVTFDVTAKLVGDTITGVATTQLRMTDFGFEPPNFANLFSVADEFTARVEFTFAPQGS